jgi:hypothetical protein
MRQQVTHNDKQNTPKASARVYGASTKQKINNHPEP